MQQTQPLRLFLVRHGQSAANAAGRMQGRLDSPLTAMGERQAEAIANRVARESPIHAIYASPLQRALSTAQAIGRKVNLDPILLDGLMENDIGDATGMTWEECKERWPDLIAERANGNPGWGWPNGETRGQLGVRAAQVMNDILSYHFEGNVVVVSHGGTLRYAMAHLMAGTEHGHPGHEFDNCAVTEVAIHGQSRHIACLNDTSHLAEIEEEEVHAGA